MVITGLSLPEEGGGGEEELYLRCGKSEAVRLRKAWDDTRHNARAPATSRPFPYTPLARPVEMAGSSAAARRRRGVFTGNQRSIKERGCEKRGIVTGAILRTMSALLKPP